MQNEVKWTHDSLVAFRHPLLRHAYLSPIFKAMLQNQFYEDKVVSLEQRIWFRGSFLFFHRHFVDLSEVTQIDDAAMYGRSLR